MKRLYHQLYLTVIASLLLVVAGAGALWRLASSASPAAQAFELAGELTAAVLPSAHIAPATQQQALDRLYERLKIDLALFDADRRPVAAAGRPLPVPRDDRETGGWQYGPHGPAWAIRLPDDRWIVARAPPRHRHPAVGLVLFLGAIALAVAVCAYPIVRGLTGRLERLQAGVESLGAGDLSARVKVEGKDEVARLAESFNGAAARIEDLVGAHKLLLAHASHELRTPLSRIRLGVELLKEAADGKRKAELENDIAELDDLIEQILLASRLDAVKTLEVREDIDLLALAAEEATRSADCTVSGQSAIVQGDPILVRRMVRNLIENGHRHGRPPVEVEVHAVNGSAAVAVSDSGPGIAAGERERVFAPFYRGAERRSVKGTGLGLALVRQIARRHGGDAVWRGTPQRPSTIHVTIPITRGSA
ncbi:MAG: sensor histidine kinase [Hyphomicrobiaceae bacterium]